MKFLFVISALLAIGWAEERLASVRLNSSVDIDSDDSEHRNEVQIVRGTYSTPLDHFSPTDPRKLRLTYHANFEFYRTGGPIFFYFGIGGIRWLQSGLVFDLASRLNAALIAADQRYFGLNRWNNPPGPGYNFLTYDHIVADVPYLVREVKSELGAPNARVIVWGSRIGGLIAGMARKRYPHVVDGAWASSGVFRSVAVDTDFFDAVARNLYFYGQSNCSNRTKDAFYQIQQLVEARDGATLQRIFNFCDPPNFNLTQEIQALYLNAFLYIPRYIDVRHFNGLREYCSDIEYGNDPIQAFGRWVRYAFRQDGECVNYNYKQYIETVSNPRTDYRPRYFLFCTQFGFMFRVTTNGTSANIFPNVIRREYYDTLCSDIFGDIYNRTLFEQAVSHFNVRHGSQNQIISNAIFSNGNLDPSISHSITEYDIRSSEAVVTQYSSASADLESISNFDTVELVATKRRIVAALTRFSEPNTYENDGNC